MTITMEGEARCLRVQGYAVLVPMRRGRGWSDGVYGEELYYDLATHAPRDCSAGLTDALEDLRANWAHGLVDSFVPFCRKNMGHGGMRDSMILTC